MIYEFGFSPVVAVVYLSGEERALGAREYAHCEDEWKLEESSKR